MTNKHDSKESEIVEIKESVDEINYDVVLSGPLYIDPLMKEPGFVYKFIADRPGDIETYKRWGYHIVQDSIRVGDTRACDTSRFGSAVTIQSKCGVTLVLMRTSVENESKLMKHRKKQHDARIEGLGHKVGTKYGDFDSDFKIS